MKKLISSLVAAAFVASSAMASWAQFDKISASTNIDLESETVNMYGKKVAQASVAPEVTVNLPFNYGEAYTGVWANYPTNESGANEALFTLGYTAPIPVWNEMFSFNTGWMYHWYTSSGTDKLAAAASTNYAATNYLVNRANEVYFGFDADFQKQYVPTFGLYGFYNFAFEQTMLKLSADYSLDLAQFGLNQFALDLGAYIGVVNAKRANGDQGVKVRGTDLENGYTFGGIKADIVYTVNDTASVSIGGRYNVNNDGTATIAGTSNNGITFPAIQMNNRGGESSFWWGSSVNFRF